MQSQKGRSSRAVARYAMGRSQYGSSVVVGQVSDGNCRDQILANAPEAAHGFFLVPKVVE